MSLDLKSRIRKDPLIDLMICVALVFIALTVWSMDGAEGLPFWAGPSDPLLEGPDSGEWASNASAFSDGRYDDLDPHRMPAYLILTGLMSKFTPSIAYAGHLVNHLLHTLLPLVIYGICRLMGSRSVGLGAAVMVAVSPMLVAASWRFGVDPTVAFMVPLTLLGALVAGKWWKLSPIAGLVGALGASAHFTTLFHPVAALLAVALVAKGWRNRLLSCIGYVFGVVAGLLVIFNVFPFAGVSGLRSALFEGIVPGSQPISGSSEAVAEPAISLLQSGLSGSIGGSISSALEQLYSSGVPWGFMVFSVWFGLLGIGLKKPTEGGRLSGFLSTIDWRGGLMIAACLAPLPLLHASGAEPRYSHNLLPLAAVVYMRGLVSASMCVELFIREIASRFTTGDLPKRLLGVLGLVVAIFVSRSYWYESVDKHVQGPPAMSATASWAIGNRLGELFPDYGGAVSPLREALVYGEKSYCPYTVCPVANNTGAFWDCLRIADEECEGDGDIPWLVVWRARFDERSDARKEMDRWLIDQFGELDTIEVPFGNPEFTATFISIPRDEITAYSQER